MSQQRHEPATDPAKARFFAIQGTRLLGVAFVIVGMMIARGSLWPSLPDWVGYLAIANGLVDIFVIPLRLQRRWRTPPERDEA
jgi:hypothetical protein